jgi:hypothetical protein
MYTTTITNPTTGRKNVIRVFPIATKEAVHIANEKGVKALSWELLDQPESLDAMAAEMGGESARSNFALNVFESALDWGLGMTVVRYIKYYSQLYPGKQPKEVRAAVNRKGDVFIIDKNNRIVYG